MNPILLKTLISLTASNSKPASGGTVGSDMHLKNRTVLFSDEATDIPEWGISGLPAMILGAAPQTCLFVGDLITNTPNEDNTPSDLSGNEAPNKASNDAPSDETVSFSLTIKSPPEQGSSLSARTIVWKLTVPIAGYRDVQTTANTPSVRAPVIKTQIKLGGIKRDVDIGLLEMSGLDQPLLIGKDTLGDKFLIRPDRPEDAKPPKPPSVNLASKPQNDGPNNGTITKSDMSKPSETDENTCQSSVAKTKASTVPDSNDTGKKEDTPESDDIVTSDSKAPAGSGNDITPEPIISDDTPQAKAPAPETENPVSSLDTTTHTSGPTPDSATDIAPTPPAQPDETTPVQ